MSLLRRSAQVRALLCSCYTVDPGGFLGGIDRPGPAAVQHSVHLMYARCVRAGVPANSGTCQGRWFAMEGWLLV